MVRPCGGSMCWGNMRGKGMPLGKGIWVMGKVGSYNWGSSMVGKPGNWGSMVQCRSMVENWGMGNNSGLFNMVCNSSDLLECWVGNSFGLEKKNR